MRGYEGQFAIHEDGVLPSQPSLILITHARIVLYIGC